MNFKFKFIDVISDSTLKITSKKLLCQTSVYDQRIISTIVWKDYENIPSFSNYLCAWGEICFMQFKENSMIQSVQFGCSVVFDSLWPTDCSPPGFPVHHQLPELAQAHVHWVSDAMLQPSLCKCRCVNTNLFC